MRLTKLHSLAELSYRRGTRVSGIIYLRSIQNVRVSRSEEEVIKMFKHLCGERSLSHVALVTTHWSLPVDCLDETRELQLATSLRFFGSAGVQRVQVQRLKNRYSKEDAMGILRPLAQLSTITLDVQLEMVCEGSSFMETSSGIQARKTFDDTLEELGASLRLQQEVSSMLAKETRLTCLL